MAENPGLQLPVTPDLAPTLSLLQPPWLPVPPQTCQCCPDTTGPLHLPFSTPVTLPPDVNSFSCSTFLPGHFLSEAFPRCPV